MKQDDCWTGNDQRKADAFAEHLIKIFIPNNREVYPNEKQAILNYQEFIPHQTGIMCLSRNGVRIVISKRINAKRAPE